MENSSVENKVNHKPSREDLYKPNKKEESGEASTVTLEFFQM